MNLIMVDPSRIVNLDHVVKVQFWQVDVNDEDQAALLILTTLATMSSEYSESTPSVNALTIKVRGPSAERLWDYLVKMSATF